MPATTRRSPAHRAGDAPLRRRASLARSFGFAAAGVADAALRERNLRVHLALGVLAACGAAVLELSGAERAALLLCVGAVVAAETLNSAIEVLADAVFPGPDERARFAKDAAAGAVLALAVASVAVGWVVVAPRLHELAGGGGRLAVPAAGALVAAGAAAVLPAASRRGAAARLSLVVLAGAGLGVVTPFSRSHVALLVAALLVAVGAGAGARGAAGKGPPAHEPPRVA